MSARFSAMIPIQVLADIDSSRNPMQLTKDRLERTATENQFMNGKILAVSVHTFAVNTASINADRYLDLQEPPRRCVASELSPASDSYKGDIMVRERPRSSCRRGIVRDH